MHSSRLFTSVVKEETYGNPAAPSFSIKYEGGKTNCDVRGIIHLNIKVVSLYSPSC